MTRRLLRGQLWAWCLLAPALAALLALALLNRPATPTVDDWPALLPVAALEAR